MYVRHRVRWPTLSLQYAELKYTYRRGHCQSILICLWPVLISFFGQFVVLCSASAEVLGSNFQCDSEVTFEIMCDLRSEQRNLTPLLLIKIFICAIIRRKYIRHKYINHASLICSQICRKIRILGRPP